MLPFTVILAMWLIKSFELVMGVELGWLGVYPRKLAGMFGILTAPLIHGSIGHLASNSISFVMLGAALVFFYPKVALKVFVRIYLLSGLLVFIFGRQVFHIGASGLVFGFAFFLFWSGIFRKDMASLAVALLVSFFYGSMIWGIFPLEQGISWESHLFGGLVGSIYAYVYRKIDPPDQPSFIDNPDEEINIEYRTYRCATT